MAENWEQVKTRNQDRAIIVRTVKALENLASCTESKDLIDDILIARVNHDDEHYKAVYLTLKGLVEREHCSGHQKNLGTEWSGGATGIEYCQNLGIKEIYSREELESIVRDYHLTLSEVSKVHKSLKI